jgi:hypothetical protein
MPPVLEPPETAVRSQKQAPTFARRLWISAIRFTAVVLIAAMLAGAWYVAKKGFGRQWRYRITEELHKHGVEARIRRLTLDPFRGLVARDVKIFDYKHRENMLAVISEISLDINYAALLHGQPFINALDVRNAQLTLPLGGPKGKVEKAQLHKVRAHIYFPPEQIYVSQAEGTFCGVRISATGQLIKRKDYQPSPPLSEEEWQKRLTILRRITSELQKLSFSGAAPSLQLKFSGDLAQLEDARVEATLHGDRIQRDKYELRDLALRAEWVDQAVNVTQCEWKDAAGTFSGHGSWSRKTNDATFEARSSIDLKLFSEAVDLGRLVADTTFNTPPIIEVSGAANFGGARPQAKLMGRVGIGSFAYRGVPMTELTADFSWDGERTLLRDVHVRQENGQLDAELFDGPNDFRLNIDSTISPSALKTALSPDLQKFLGEWEWQSPPTIHLEIRGPDHEPAGWRGKGKVALERTRFRGIWLNNATADISFGDGAVTYENFRVARDEGIGSGNFTYDFKNHEVRLSNIKSSLRPAEAIFWIDPQLWKTVAPYKFRQPPNVTANGVYQFQGGKNTRLEINVDGPGGMDYVFLGKTLPFDRISGKLVFTNDRLEILDLKGGLFSGNVRGAADISLAHNDPHYHANIAVKALDFPRLTDLYYQYKTAQGQLNGSYDFKGFGSDARQMHGTGKVEVTNGNVFAIPIFGPLSEILNTVVPGSGYSIARKATASFSIKDGVIHTDDFDAAGGLFGIVGHGDIHFLDDKLDFEVRLNANGPGVLLTPMYKLFEYVGEGSLKKPNWHPKRF